MVLNYFGKCTWVLIITVFKSMDERNPTYEILNIIGVQENNKNKELPKIEQKDGKKTTVFSALYGALKIL